MDRLQESEDLARSPEYELPELTSETWIWRHACHRIRLCRYGWRHDVPQDPHGPARISAARPEKTFTPLNTEFSIENIDDADIMEPEPVTSQTLTPP